MVDAEGRGGSLAEVGGGGRDGEGDRWIREGLGEVDMVGEVGVVFR